MTITRSLLVGFLLAMLGLTWFNSQRIEPPKPKYTSLAADQALAPIVAEKTVAPSQISALVKVSTERDIAFLAFIETLPASLQNLPKPAALNTNALGELVVDEQVRYLFEFYLTAMGEESLDNIIARIQFDLQSQFTGTELAKVQTLLENYLLYRNHVGDIKNHYVAITGDSTGVYDLAAVISMKQAVRVDRLAYFSPADANALFLSEDEYDDYMLALAQVGANADLSDFEKAQQLTRIEADAAPWIIETNHQANLVSTIRNQEKVMKAQGADSQSLHQVREQAYGAPAAQRLAQLDAEQAQWQQRVAAYRIDLGSLRASSSGARVDAKLLGALRQTHFNGTELARIAALDED